MRWSSTYPVLTSAQDLDGVIVLGFDPDDGPEVRRALAVMAPTDHLAARTLLQGLLGGLCNLAHRVGRDDDAVDDIVRLAWERIRTYPASRPGSVSANVLLDVRKRYRREQDKARRQIASCVAVEAPSAEEQFVSRAFLEELVSASASSGIWSMFAGQVAPNLAPVLGHALVHEGLIIGVILIHGCRFPRGKYRSGAPVPFHRSPRMA